MSSLVEQRPAPSQPRPYRFPEVVRRTAAGGAVVAAHLPGQPLAVAALLLDAGAGREPPGQEGVASVLADALEEGTATRDAAAYALARESLGAELSIVVDWDSFRAGVTAPADRLPAAVQLLAEAVRTPRLDPADVTRVRDDAVTALRMSWAAPGPRADAALRADLFGAVGAADRRYARPLHGTPGTVAAVGVDDVVAYHGSWLTRCGTLLVAGDLDRLDLDQLAAAAFAGAGPQPEPVTTEVEAPARAHRRVVLVDRPGSVQSVLRLGHTAPPRAHPEYVPIRLAGTVLGGAFTSRLNHLLREVRGYTYGMRAEYAMTRRFGRFTVSASVQTAVTAPALVDTIAEITRTQAEGVTEEELAVGRTWRAGQLTVDMQTPSAIADALATLVVHDLPDGYHAALRQRLLQATVAEVSAAARTYLRPEALTVVVEGDAAAIREAVEATGIGEVTVAEPG
ncbi:MAG: insulinase family protein [Micromonosporaceae bacterium]|nr:insulinase family protein [Micromonosporaceae bacterium]